LAKQIFIGKAAALEELNSDVALRASVAGTNACPATKLNLSSDELENLHGSSVGWTVLVSNDVHVRRPAAYVQDRNTPSQLQNQKVSNVFFSADYQRRGRPGRCSHAARRGATSRG
jgi:hypothetical protein